MKRFENRTVVITGSNRGLGLEILKQFASEGANIIACMRSEKEETKATLNAIAEFLSLLYILICQMKLQ